MANAKSCGGENESSFFQRPGSERNVCAKRKNIGLGISNEGGRCLFFFEDMMIFFGLGEAERKVGRIENVHAHEERELFQRTVSPSSNVV